MQVVGSRQCDVLQLAQSDLSTIVGLRELALTRPAGRKARSTGEALSMATPLRGDNLAANKDTHINRGEPQLCGTSAKRAGLIYRA